MNAREILLQSDTVEVFTPPEYIEAARRVMGSIDLDPASASLPQKWIRATTIYTEETDGLAHYWYGNVWLNPPYGTTPQNYFDQPGLLRSRSFAGVWADYLIKEWAAGRVRQAILLLNNNTSERWFQPLYEFPMCFTKRRIRYLYETDIASVDRDGRITLINGMTLTGEPGEMTGYRTPPGASKRKKNGPTHGNVFVYIGPDEGHFYREFSKFGTVTWSIRKMAGRRLEYA